MLVGNPEGKNHLEGYAVYGTVILKRILQKSIRKDLGWVVWLEIGRNTNLLVSW
jgi:thiamine kinase-like enzyme